MIVRKTFSDTHFLNFAGRVVSLFGVGGLTVPKYDIEFRGFTESDVVNSVNPLNSLSYPPNSRPATLNRGTTAGRTALDKREKLRQEAEEFIANSRINEEDVISITESGDEYVSSVTRYRKR